MLKLSCYTCGAKLELTEDIDRFMCSFCGNEFLVQRQGGVVNLKPVEEALDEISLSSKTTASFTGITAENTEILAQEAKLKIVREKIREAEQKITEIENSKPEPPVCKKESLACSIIFIFLFLMALGGVYAGTTVYGKQSPVFIYAGLVCGVIVVLLFLSMIKTILINLTYKKEFADEMKKHKEVVAGFEKENRRKLFLMHEIESLKQKENDIKESILEM
ncbi:MAG: hypothetical protein LWY06_10275 [Firmicutes bacterium]|nr:hypothetical protein [Bacillota bacterium]